MRISPSSTNSLLGDKKLLGAAIAAVVLVAGLAWVSPEGAEAHHSACPRFRKAIRDAQDIGPIFRFDDFRDDSDAGAATAGDGVPNQFSASSDYQTGNASGHCRRNVFQPEDFASGNTVLHQEIFRGVDNTEGKKSGDVSVYVTYRAEPGDTFRATASVNLFADGGDFRGRLKIVGLRMLNGKLTQVKPEYNVDICRPNRTNQRRLCKATDGDNYQTISVTGEMCPTTEYVNVVFRARENQTERAYGVAALDWIEFERIPDQSLGECPT